MIIDNIIEELKKSIEHKYRILPSDHKCSVYVLLHIQNQNVDIRPGGHKNWLKSGYHVWDHLHFEDTQLYFEGITRNIHHIMTIHDPNCFDNVIKFLLEN